MGNKVELQTSEIPTPPAMNDKFFMWRRWKEVDIWGRPTDPTNEKKNGGRRNGF